MDCQLSAGLLLKFQQFGWMGMNGWMNGVEWLERGYYSAPFSRPRLNGWNFSQNSHSSNMPWEYHLVIACDGQFSYWGKFVKYSYDSHKVGGSLVDFEGVYKCDLNEKKAWDNIPPIVGTWCSKNCPCTNRRAKLDFPTAVSPIKTILHGSA